MKDNITYNAYIVFSIPKMEELIEQNYIRLQETMPNSSDHRTQIDKHSKLCKFKEFLNGKYKRWNPRKSPEIPFKISSKGYGILQGVQIPLYSPQEIENIIDYTQVINTVEEDGIKQLRFECYKLEGKEKSEIEEDVEYLRRDSIPFIYIGNKLYLIRYLVPEGASKLNEKLISMNNSNRNIDLTVNGMENVYSKDVFI